MCCCAQPRVPERPLDSVSTSPLNALEQGVTSPGCSIVSRSGWWHTRTFWRWTNPPSSVRSPIDAVCAVRKTATGTRFNRPRRRLSPRQYRPPRAHQGGLSGLATRSAQTVTWSITFRTYWPRSPQGSATTAAALVVNCGLPCSTVRRAIDLPRLHFSSSPLVPPRGLTARPAAVRAPPVSSRPRPA
jgi:hypothetical protein